MNNSSLSLITNIDKPTDIVDSLPERQMSLKYPIDALGEVLGGAAKRLAYHVQVPEGMAAQSVLAVASLVAQSHINVSIPSIIGFKPVSLYFLSVAESGDRKSSIDTLALAPINDYQAHRFQNFQEEIKRYHAAIDAWKQHKESVIKRSQNAEMTEQDRENLEEELFNLEESKPKHPARSNILFSEPTPEGIFKHYQQGLPSAGLFSDEGISFFNGHGMKDEAKGRTIGMLSHLWDGKSISRTRGAGGESSVLNGCRLTTHLMLQPIIAEKIFTDPIMQGQGIMARFLIFDAPSLAGSRLLKGRDLTNGAYTDLMIIRYIETVKTFLNRSINVNEKTGELILESFEIKGDALKEWSTIHDAIEKQIALGGNFEDIKPFASKAAEYVARIAAILSFFEMFDSPKVDHIQRAGLLVDFYLKTMANRTKEAEYAKEDLFARDLLDWIKVNGGLLKCSNFKYIKPTSIRSAKKARKILALLVDLGHLRVTEFNNRTGFPSIWEVNPQ